MTKRAPRPSRSPLSMAVQVPGVGRCNRAAHVALAVGLSTALLASPVALAQQQRPAAQRAQQAPAAAPAAPADAGTGPTVVQVKPEPSQTSWTKVCGKDPANQKEICYTTRDFVSDQGQPVLAVAIYDVKGDPQRVLRFLLPFGMLLQPGVRIGVDQGQPVAGRYQICFPNGCFAEAMINEAQTNALKRGKLLNVSMQNQVAREVSFQIPLEGFTKAFDGAPIDPAELERQQKTLQDEIAKREEDLRRRLSGEAAPAAPATTPPARP